MTQKAPERFWLRWEPGKAITQGPLTEHPDFTEYLRADHALALVAAAYEDAGDAAADVYDRRDLPTGADLAGYIRTIATDDAQAALERVKQEARNEALREAAELAKYEGEEFAGMREGVMFDRLSKKILALITEEQSDE